MCGIAGIYNFRTNRPVDRESLERMARVQTHRGPDDEGFFLDGPLGFAHRRLAIISPESGKQPMMDEGGNVVVFNGEIYNYIELREALRKRRPFRTGSDTEVILAAYQHYGTECLTHFNGMFAFALWDGARLFLARDRLGIKPLYYAFHADGIVFASEVKAILESGCVTPALAPEALSPYLHVGYVPGEETMFAGIRKLPPGARMVVEGGTWRIERYWELAFAPEAIPEAEALEHFEELLRDAIRLRLRSDVPLGVFLSGGLDSSAVVAFLAEDLDRPLETFSVCYRMAGYDETPYARQVAERFGTIHREIAVTPESFLADFPRFVWQMDEPVTEAAAISLHHVARLAREHVTVVLSGEGADEILAGYEIYGYMTWLERYRALPGALRALLGGIARRVGDPRIRKYAALADLPLEARYLGVSFQPPQTLHLNGASLLRGEIVAEMARFPSFPDRVAEIYRQSEGAGLLNRMLHLDTVTWLPDDILIKADKMSMAPSLELRVPFLDHRLVAWCARLPEGFKRRGGRGKYLLRRSVRRRLPPAVLRRSKMGFPTPLAFLFRGPLYDYARQILLDERTRARKIIDTTTAERMLAAHREGADHHRRIWQMLVLETWMRIFLDGERP
ncbi:MAG: asparagine synthase (glutamine-hydrolyzing) [Deltaproteobacteria bacterium]|nr:MAG: asparagine synthase (glutamine-hydrolyzing) [Deltaproteobacteria bacterium]